MIGRQLTDALRRNYLKTSLLLIKQLTEKGDSLGVIPELARNDKDLLPIMVRHLSFATKMHLLQSAGSSPGMDVMISPLLEDPAIQKAIRDNFGDEKANLILSPIFIQGMTYHLSVDNNIFSSFDSPLSPWKGFRNPEDTFRAMVKSNFMYIKRRSFTGYGFEDHIHPEHGYTEMTRLRFEGQKLFPVAYQGLQQDLTELLIKSILRDDFPLYTTALQNIIATNPIILDDIEAAKYSCYLDPKWCQLQVGKPLASAYTLIPTLQALQELPEKDPIKLLIHSWFNKAITPDQLVYAKTLRKKHGENLSENPEVNRLISCIVGSIIEQQESQYTTQRDKVAQQVMAALPNIPRQLSKNIAFLAEEDKAEKKDESKATDTKNVIVSCNSVNYGGIARDFILEDIQKFLQDTKGRVFSLFNSGARHILQPIAKIIPVLTKKSETYDVNNESYHYMLQICLVLLIDPAAQNISAIRNMTGIFYKKVVGEHLAAILQVGAKESQEALRQDVVAMIKERILLSEEYRREDFSIISLVAKLEMSLMKQPTEELTLELKL